MPFDAGFKNIRCIDYDEEMRLRNSILPSLLKETCIRYEGLQYEKINKNARADKNTLEIIRIMNAARSYREKREKNDLYLSFGEYRPCDCFYDQINLVRRMKEDSPQVIDELQEIIKSSAIGIDERPISKAIKIQATKREKKIKAVDKKNSNIAKELENNSPRGLYSRIEFEELSGGLKDKLLSQIADQTSV